MWHASSVSISVQFIFQYLEGNDKKIILLSSKGDTQMNDTTVSFGDLELIIGHNLCKKGLLSGYNKNKGSI